MKCGDELAATSGSFHMDDEGRLVVRLHTAPGSPLPPSLDRPSPRPADRSAAALHPPVATVAERSNSRSHSPSDYGVVIHSAASESSSDTSGSDSDQDQPTMLQPQRPPTRAEKHARKMARREKRRMRIEAAAQAAETAADGGLRREDGSSTFLLSRPSSATGSRLAISRNLSARNLQRSSAPLSPPFPRATPISRNSSSQRLQQMADSADKQEDEAGKSIFHGHTSSRPNSDSSSRLQLPFHNQTDRIKHALGTHVPASPVPTSPRRSGSLSPRAPNSSGESSARHRIRPRPAALISHPSTVPMSSRRVSSTGASPIPHGLPSHSSAAAAMEVYNDLQLALEGASIDTQMEPANREIHVQPSPDSGSPAAAHSAKY